jgi:hypothetical protein
MLDFICEYFWIGLTIISVLTILIGFGKGLWVYVIKPMFKPEKKKDIRDLNWTATKKRCIWIGHLFNGHRFK